MARHYYLRFDSDLFGAENAVLSQDFALVVRQAGEGSHGRKRQAIGFLEAMEYPEDWDSFLDRNTGTIVAITDNERPYVEDGEEKHIDGLPAWQRESVLEVRRALEEADLVRLPSKFDIHEWEIMRRFADSLGDSERAEVLDAIHGAGAFRVFRRASHAAHSAAASWAADKNQDRAQSVLVESHAPTRAKFVST